MHTIINTPTQTRTQTQAPFLTRSVFMPSSIVLHYFHPPSPYSVGEEPLPDSVALWFGWKGLILSLSLFLSVWHRCSVGPLRLKQTHKHTHTAPFAREVPCGPWSQTFSGGDFRRERLHPRGSWELFLLEV